MTIRDNAYSDASILFKKCVIFIFMLQNFYLLTKERRRERKLGRQMKQRKPILQPATDMEYMRSDCLIFFDVTIYVKIILCWRAIFPKYMQSTSFHVNK